MLGDIIQPTHLLFILVIALLVLGPKRLPEVGRSLGRGIRDFRQGMEGVQDEARSVFSLDEPDTPTAVSTTQDAPAATPEPVVAPAPEPVVAPPAPDAAPTATAVVGAAPTTERSEPDPADYAD